MKKLNIRAGLRTRNFRVGGYSVFASLMVAALAVMVNVLVNALPASVTQLDTNANQLFSISDQTEQVVEGLETPVEIYWVVQSGAEDSTLSLLLDRYAAMSDQITITKKDPDTDPGFITQYVSDGVYNNSQALMEVCEYRGIACYNASDSSFSGIHAADEAFRSSFFLTSTDGYHLNERGQALFLPRIAGWIAAQLSS